MISVCMVSREYFGRGLCFWMERIPGPSLFLFQDSLLFGGDLGRNFFISRS